MRLLDTNICVYIIRRRPPAGRARLTECESEGLAVSVITAMELEIGARRSTGSAYARQVAAFLATIDVQPLADSARAAYGTLRHDLERRGSVIGPLDMLIAAHALALGATLVTNNEREFKRVKGLTVENWVA